MVEYDIKRGHWKLLEGDLLPKMMNESFGNVAEEGDLYVSRYGAMERVEVRMVNKTTLHLVTKASTDVSDEEVLDSKRALNRFAEAATGFNSKQRMKRAQKKAKEGSL